MSQINVLMLHALSVLKALIVHAQLCALIPYVCHYMIVHQSFLQLMSNYMILCILLQDEQVDGCGDGSWKGKRYFSCKDGHSLFTVPSRLKPDRRHVNKHSLVIHGKFIMHSLTPSAFCKASVCAFCLWFVKYSQIHK